MFAFIKKLLGFDEKTMKDAGVQVEQAPYKVETLVVDLADIAIAQRPAPVVEAPKVEAAPAAQKKPRGKKPQGQKSQQLKQAKPAPAKAPAKKSGRKPKSKTQA